MYLHYRGSTEANPHEETMQNYENYGEFENLYIIFYKRIYKNLIM